MGCTPRAVALLGSTGSIGRSTLEVIAASQGRLRAVGLTAHSQLELLEEQARQFKPQWIVATDEPKARRYAWRKLPPGVELHFGLEAVNRLVSEPSVDIVVAALVGSVGLYSTWAALEAGKPVALANKETLVMAGPWVTELAKRRNAPILPVDSEHSAVFQALQAGRRHELRRILLTASGGPFRTWSIAQMSEATVAQTLNHPTWNMGRKITVDSATLMNKALELIEARWLFDLSPDQIEVVIHPQSIVHALVEFIDGSVIAQLSPPDMRLPIQYALSYPERWECPAAKLDFGQLHELTFQAPDFDRFPALALGYEVARRGGTAGAVLNAANEAAVAAFLEGRIKLTDIPAICRSVLDAHVFDANPTIETLVRLDAWARQEVTKWMEC
ncbi:MAG: 1-deoxy-D-xylulose 5-phosphate reductoisomerase [Pirellulaceae bacterium]|nr:MAG: 1-deoxy-D-xylulose 5-phosphate reductoisomerase [Pirellulaceae bacterium]